MKKLLLLSVLAVSAMSVNAESFGDYYKLLYEGKEVANDQEIVVKHAEYDAEWKEYNYECVLQIVNMKDEAGKMFGGMYFTGTPTYDEVIEGMMQDPKTWGMPQICGEQCFGMTKGYVGEGYNDILPSSAGLEQTWQIHIQSIATDDKVSKYDLFFAACDENGERIKDADINLHLIFGSGKKSQSIDWRQEFSNIIIDDKIELLATASSGLNVVYTSSNEEIAKIEGNKVNFLSAGEVIITASQSGNNEFDSAKNIDKTIIINKKSQSIEWNQELSDITVGDQILLTATSSSGLPVEYVSSDSRIAEIVEGNLVISHKSGVVEITAHQAGNDTYKSAEPVYRSIIVNKSYDEQLTLNQSNTTLETGQTLQLIIEEYEWTSSDEEVLLVSESGLVTAVGIGEAVITLSRKTDGATLASCSCIVKINDSGVPELSLEKQIRINCIGNNVKIEGASRSSLASVHDFKGRTIYSGIEKNIYLPQGVYIITIENSQFKILIK